MTDIWNGNSAVQIQPPIGPDDEPAGSDAQPSLSATLEGVDVTSLSGRGVVNIDGGALKIIGSCVHDCAATGVYVGGPRSQVVIERTDVLRNGRGNSTHRRGIGRE